MSLDAPAQLLHTEEEGEAQLLSPLTNPNDTTFGRRPGSHAGSGSGNIHVGGTGHISPRLTVRTPLSSNRNSLVSDRQARLPSATSSRSSPAGEDVSQEPNPNSLTAAFNHILLSESSANSAAAEAGCHACGEKGHVEPPPRTAPSSYARSRKADPQGYLFTCYLDYSRSMKPRPPADLFGSYVRPERLQYSTACSSPCETPRSSASSNSPFISLPALNGRLPSRPPTPAPILLRAKEVHKFAMTGVPVDVKELSNFYMFVAEIPGMKSSDVKVQIENESILKITGERRREQCEEDGDEVKYVRVERQAGRFTRKFNLPANADVDHISAACQDGLLSVVVPKTPPLEQHRPKTFEVKIAT